MSERLKNKALINIARNILYDEKVKNIKEDIILQRKKYVETVKEEEKMPENKRSFTGPGYLLRVYHSQLIAKYLGPYEKEFVMWKLDDENFPVYAYVLFITAPEFLNDEYLGKVRIKNFIGKPLKEYYLLAIFLWCCSYLTNNGEIFIEQNKLRPLVGFLDKNKEYIHYDVYDSTQHQRNAIITRLNFEVPRSLIRQSATSWDLIEVMGVNTNIGGDVTQVVPDQKTLLGCMWCNSPHVNFVEEDNEDYAFCDALCQEDFYEYG